MENGSDWEANLPHALLALRIATKDSTGFSPAELVSGRKLRIAETLVLEQWVGESQEHERITKYAFKLINHLKRY